MKSLRNTLLTLSAVSIMSSHVAASDTFADRFSKLSVGTNTALIEALLGKPDEIKTTSVLGVGTKQYVYSKTDGVYKITIIADHLTAKTSEVKTSFINKFFSN